MMAQRAPVERCRVGMVVPGYEEGGGVPAVADFLAAALERIGGFQLDFISPAVRWNDPLNVCVARPRSWLRAPGTEEIVVRGRALTRVGARWAEAELMRYWQRRALDAAVARADIVQVVCGSAVWAYALRRVRQPLFIQVATTLRVEREVGCVARRQGILGKMMTRLCEPLERAALRRADAVFVENAWMLERLRGELDPARVHFAPPGVDTDFFRPEASAARDCLLFVGRLGDPRKNVRLLLAAYCKIRDALPTSPPLVLAGYTNLSTEDARFLAEAGLQPHVAVLANPDRAALAALYRRCRVFLLGSNEEGFGIVLTEAMASGAPVVSTDCGGPRTVVEEGRTGFLVPVGDAAAMADRVVRLLRDDELRSMMGRAARERVEREFSIEVCGHRFADVYRKVLAVNDSHL